MTKEEFLRAFHLSQPPSSRKNDSRQKPDSKNKKDKKEAAVLIALIEEQVKGVVQLSVLLTKRAAHLRHHGGQVSFPGGKVEGFDQDMIATALRETEEEVGIKSSSIEVIGQLQQHQTTSGFIVTPIVAFINTDFIDADFINADFSKSVLMPSDFTNLIKRLNNTIDKNEVEEVFLVPLAHFLNDDNRQSVTVRLNNQPRQVHFIPYQGYNIWGATADMLKDLADHLVR